MQIVKYGITLASIQESELELMRNWRNAEHIRPYMKYTEYITPAMQQLWFNKLDPSTNLYFMIVAGEKKIGVINLKDIDTTVSIAEAGIFIGETEYLNSMLPVLATISLMEFAFDTLGLKTLKAKIGRDNTKVIQFNKCIGYQKAEQQNDPDFMYYTVTRERFFTATEKIRKTLDKIK